MISMIFPPSRAIAGNPPPPSRRGGRVAATAWEQSAAPLSETVTRRSCAIEILNG